jgi:hypothetical protein
MKISEPLDQVQDPQLGRAAVVINDVQWADATTLELLDYLLTPGHCQPCFQWCSTCRGEYTRRRHW